jgi:hypothetical protein
MMITEHATLCYVVRNQFNDLFITNMQDADKQLRQQRNFPVSLRGLHSFIVMER